MIDAKVRWLLIAVAALAVPTIAFTQAKPKPKPKAEPAQRVVNLNPLAPFAADVRKALEIAMFDYPSAHFRDVRLGRYNDEAVACGYVNGKNRLGGYTGWTPFYASAVAVGDTTSTPNVFIMDSGRLTGGYLGHCDGMILIPGEYSDLLEPGGVPKSK